jgi:isochorismate synthase
VPPLRRSAEGEKSVIDSSGVGQLLTQRLYDALNAARQSTSQLIALTLPAPVIKPTHAFAQLGDQSGYYFAPREHEGETGLGTAVEFVAEQIADLSALETQAKGLIEEALLIGIDAAAKVPRFYGGVAFDQAPKADGPWRDFAKVWFTLPRYRYFADGRRASLTLHLLPKELSSVADCRSWIERADHMIGRLGRAPAECSYAQIVSRHDQPSVDRWLAHVERALSCMERGELEKVVLAREIQLELDSPPDVSALLDRLGRLSPETTRFAFRHGKSVFLGATPERLVQRQGTEIRTEAVAGSIRARDTDAANRLMASEKDRHEHALVVSELVRKLELLGAELDVPNRPTIRRLRHVLHLATVIRARLVAAPHILTLLSRLHPTPAVGGVPDQDALVFMRRHEEFERGWYAAPVGWFDAHGDGEFVVALRSGLLSGSRLRLYAGAGIVKNSQPDQELQETELKLQNLLDALGPLPDDLATEAMSHPNEVPPPLHSEIASTRVEPRTQ